MQEINFIPIKANVNIFSDSGLVRVVSNQNTLLGQSVARATDHINKDYLHFNGYEKNYLVYEVIHYKADAIHYLEEFPANQNVFMARFQVSDEYLTSDTWFEGYTATTQLGEPLTQGIFKLGSWVTVVIDVIAKTIQIQASSAASSRPYHRYAEEFTATANQTVFNLTGSYTVGGNFVAVYINGILQPPASYVETSNKIITMSVGCEDGDKVLIKYETVDSLQISGETPEGAQIKADVAEGRAKAYTDIKLLPADSHITNPEIHVDARLVANWNQLSNPNMLDNADFQIWQRGTSGTTGYTADRWKSCGNISGIRSINGTSGMKVEVDSSTLFCGLYQPIVMTHRQALRLVGKQLTFSWRVSSSVNSKDFQGQLVTPTPTVLSITIDFTQADADFVGSNGYSKILLDRVGIHCLENGSALPVGFMFYVDWCKLEEGSVATPFIPKSKKDERNSCQAYGVDLLAKDIVATGQAYIGVFKAHSTTFGYGIINVPTTLVRVPDVTWSGLSLWDGTNSFAVTALACHSIGACGLQFKVDVASGLTVGQTYILYCTNKANYTLFLDADIK